MNFNNNIPDLLVVEDFYARPYEVRTTALQQEFLASNWHKGKRTPSKHILEGTKERIEELLQVDIVNWEAQGWNGVFQHCNADDPLVYHVDSQSYAAVVFLTPGAPPECGTSFFRSRVTGRSSFTPEEVQTEDFYRTFEGNFYDKTKLELVDKIGNKFNRFVAWDARQIHAASEYFGNTAENSRLFHMFFFDAVKKETKVES